jgi:aminoglycoside phosphotransferase (APT) family kinase protein
MRIPSKAQVEKYLSESLGERTNISYFGPLGEYQKSESPSDVKKMGYGSPYLIVCKSGKSREKKLILSTMRIGHGFGHDFRSDRIENMVMAFDTWSKLPGHCKVTDIGAFRKGDSSMITLGDTGEFFLVRPMVEGVEYYKDLDRIFSTGKLEKHDLLRARSLAEYLVKIHRTKNSNPDDSELYIRKIRDTVGHGECVFGLADSYPKDLEWLEERELENIEKKCVEHRWRLRNNTDRLSQVHGDFHPWNILFTSNTRIDAQKFFLLDRSRGEWGEPADDLCALSINYIFSSLRKYGELRGEFQSLYTEFLDTYLRGTNDLGVLDAMPLFYVFRCLVIASPVWYPTLSSETRRKILNFATNILEEKRFDPKKVNQYFIGR